MATPGATSSNLPVVKRRACRVVFFLTGLVYKMLNLALGATSVLSVGDAMAMFKDWNDHEQPHTSVFGSQLWFVWTVGGAGAYVFAAAAIGFIGIQSRACICLALNVSMTMLILVLELLFVVLQLLDPTWEESFLPDDPTGQLQKLKDLVQENWKLARWLAATIVCIQVLTVAVGTSLMYIPPVPSSDDWDDDELSAESPRRPLLHGIQSEQDHISAPSNPPLPSSPRVSPRGHRANVSHATGPVSGDTSSTQNSYTLRWSRDMMDKYGLDTRSLQYNPDRQAPIVSEESGPPKRRCVII